MWSTFPLKIAHFWGFFSKISTIKAASAFCASDAETWNCCSPQGHKMYLPYTSHSRKDGSVILWKYNRSAVLIRLRCYIWHPKIWLLICFEKNKNKIKRVVQSVTPEIWTVRFRNKLSSMQQSWQDARSSFESERYVLLSVSLTPSLKFCLEAPAMQLSVSLPYLSDNSRRR